MTATGPTGQRTPGTTEPTGAAPGIAGWDTIAAAYDEVVTPVAMRFAEELLARADVGPGTRMLDVAAGSGALAIPAARRGAHVVATDVSAGLIDRLARRAQAEGLAHLDAQVMDGQALDLADGTFDVAASQFGLNLFPDIPRGASELARVTRPGGTVLVAVFGSPRKAEFLSFFLGAVKATVPDFTPPDLSDAPPTRLADPEKLRRVLTDAGLTAVRVETVDWAMEFRSGTHLWELVMGSNPMGAMLVADLTEEQRANVRQVLDRMLRERSGGRPGGTLVTEVNIGVGGK